MTEPPIPLRSVEESSSDSERRSNGTPDEGLVETQASRHEFSLAPADGGKDAWLFLAACFILEALVWGELKEYVSYGAYGAFRSHIMPSQVFRSHSVCFRITTALMSPLLALTRSLSLVLAPW